ncbi:peptide chain release factor N(5)-glutamine methyltransferase [Pedobacter nyackensis]|uniref:peptide chain release factor N(5)-glutamine methyltransferase n=1 Tax=Pedobacter nyackensis TaxID=475255 RepID=UPI002931C2D9|nr:peptide chain release factor N(5)-glutamine methyltransferase [Pedobacter nyackensis]
MNYFYRMKLKDLAEQFNHSLGDIYGPEEGYAIFLLTIDNVLGYNKSQYLLKREEVLKGEQLDKLHGVLAELKSGKPLQYVLGETEFYGLPYKVSPAVLIPRPETEELVEWVIESCALAETTGSGLRIIDIGTGSGCIAISLKKHLPASRLSALDVSKEAIEVAKANATLNQLDINFINDDIRTFTSNQKFDVIVSNPPYITVREKEDMHNNVLDHEPHLALFVANEKPLEFYEAIADFAWLTLSDMGLLFFEINEHLGKEMIEMLSAKSFVNIELRKDMQGKDRMIRCKKALI